MIRLSVIVASMVAGGAFAADFAVSSYGAGRREDRRHRFENCTHRPIERLRVRHSFLWRTYCEKKHKDQEGHFLIAGCESINVTAVNCRLLPKVGISDRAP